MIRMSCIVVVLGALVLLLTGCASIISKKDYPVSITSMPSGASFVVTNKRSVDVTSGTTPQTVTLRAKDGPFQVVFNQAGQPETVATIKRKLDGWYFGNLIFGGIIGLIVDPITGAMFRLPHELHVTMGSTLSMLDSDQIQLIIVSIETIDPAIRDQLIPLQ